ncbi:MAG: hypothetical protein KDA44_03110 [Planctomycetales bacterium]|nr:hypothetical protein [Planctomycetales bacterium]
MTPAQRVLDTFAAAPGWSQLFADALTGALPRGWLDSLVVVAYLAATVFIGLKGAKWLAPRRASASQEQEDDYFLAGRNVPGWLNGVSYAVTLVNADVAPAYCGVAVVVGLPVAWFYISRFGLALMLAALLFAVRWRQLGIRTGPEFFSLRFGNRSARWVRTYTSAYSVVIGTIPWIGAGLLGVHMIFAPIVGIDSKTVTLLIILPVMVSYVWFSGFAGVLATDFMQTIVILGANLCVLVAVFAKFGGPAGVAAAIESALPEKAHEILSLTPVPGHHLMGPLAVAAWLVVSTVGVGGNVAFEGQRLFSCRSPRSAASVGVWCQIALFAMLALLTLPMLGVLANHPEMYSATPQVRETAYGLLLADFLPPGALGLALAALLAAVMSTVAGHINYGSQTLLNDVCRPFVPQMTEHRALLTGRLLMLLVLGLAIVVMAFADSLVGIAVVVVGLFGSTLTFGWGQWWWWRANFPAWCAATFGGPILYAVLMQALPYWPWWREQAALSPSAQQTMAMLQAAITMAATTVLWIAVALATTPEDMATLRQFYLRARPMGLWGPVRKALLADGVASTRVVQPRGALLAGAAIAVLGATWTALATMALSAAVGGMTGKAIALALTAAGLAYLFLLAFRWHVARLTGDRPTDRLTL